MARIAHVVASSSTGYAQSMRARRHEIRAGFDNAYTPETVDLSINDDVRLTYRSAPSATGAPAGPVSVQLFNTPLQQKRAVMITSLYAQDSYSYKRLTAVGGDLGLALDGL